MILSILCGILFLSSITLIFRNEIGRNGVCLLLISFNIVSFTTLVIIFFFSELLVFEMSELSCWSLALSAITFKWGFYVDRLSFLFMLTILFISTIIMIYSISYMFVDIRFTHFISFLGFFVFFMLLLILSNNFIQMFIGWEGVGLVSFLLVNFWYTRLASNKGALKALIFNRVGDVGFVSFICLMVVYHGTTAVPLFYIFTNTSTLILLLVFLAAAGKSAQLLLYAWLPDAMEGPTPVSALLHSATMVTAGIFLLLRCSSYIHNANSLLVLFLLFIGLFTSITSGIFAIFKYDIKKIIAFSTCSQLGLLVCGISFGLISATFYHLFIHAFFKALLFLSSGVIIHALFDEQDIRKYGNVGSFMSFFLILNCIGTLNIIGFPYLGGFYSKENLILYPFISNSIIIRSAILLSSIITVIYSLRLVYRCVGQETYIYRNFMNNIHNSDNYITIIVSILATVAIFSGYMFSDSIVGFANNVFLNATQYYYTNITSELLIYTLFYLILLVTLNIIIIYYYILHFTSDITTYFYLFIVSWYHYCIQEFFMPMLLWSFVRIYNQIAYVFVLKSLEKGILESAGLVQLYTIIKLVNEKLFYKQITNIFYYTHVILIFCFLIYFIYPFFITEGGLDLLQFLLVITLLSYLNKKHNTIL